MRICQRALVTAALLLSAVPLRAGDAGPHQLAPGSAEMRMGPSRSRDVVIEEPRPPSAAVETEGRGRRGERHACQSEAITESECLQEATGRQ